VVVPKIGFTMHKSTAATAGRVGNKKIERVTPNQCERFMPQLPCLDHQHNSNTAAQ